MSNTEKNMTPNMEQQSQEKSSSAMDPPPYSVQTQVIQSPPPVATVPATVVPMATVHPGGMYPSVVLQHVVPMGAQPTRTHCKSCHAEITTQIQHKNTTRTHIFALIMCFVGCCLCMWIPYVMKSCKNTDHYCPNCQAYLGSYLV